MTNWPKWSPAPGWTMKPLRSSYPSSHLLGGMPYRNSAATDIRERFRAEQERIERDRIDRQRREAEERHE